MQWSDWITAIADILDLAATITAPTSQTPSTDPNFNNILPSAVSYTENRIQRDIDLLGTMVTDETANFPTNSRKLTLPTDKGHYVVVEQVYPIISGIRGTPLTPVSREFLGGSYPTDSPVGSPSVPMFFCPNDELSILVGPVADQSYGVGIVGTQRFTPLSAANPSNFLTLYWPDLYVVASMVFFAGYQRDFGQQSDDKQLAQSWENQYQMLKTPALVEEKRKLFSSTGWSCRQPSPVTPPQT